MRMSRIFFYEIKHGWAYNEKAHKVIKSQVKSTVEDQMKETMQQLETLELLDDSGKPVGSGLKFISVDQLNVDIYRIKEQRASSYMPEKFAKKANFGLVSIQNTCDNECFEWCMLYHQSEQANNGYR